MPFEEPRNAKKVDEQKSSVIEQAIKKFSVETSEVKRGNPLKPVKTEPIPAKETSQENGVEQNKVTSSNSDFSSVTKVRAFWEDSTSSENVQTTSKDDEIIDGKANGNVDDKKENEKETREAKDEPELSDEMVSVKKSLLDLSMEQTRMRSEIAMMSATLLELKDKANQARESTASANRSENSKTSERKSASRNSQSGQSRKKNKRISNSQRNQSLILLNPPEPYIATTGLTNGRFVRAELNDSEKLDSPFSFRMLRLDAFLRLSGRKTVASFEAKVGKKNTIYFSFEDGCNISYMPIASIVLRGVNKKASSFIEQKELDSTKVSLHKEIHEKALELISAGVLSGNDGAKIAFPTHEEVDGNITWEAPIMNNCEVEIVNVDKEKPLERKKLVEVLTESEEIKGKGLVAIRFSKRSEGNVIDVEFMVTGFLNTSRDQPQKVV